MDAGKDVQVRGLIDGRTGVGENDEIGLLAGELGATIDQTLKGALAMLKGSVQRKECLIIL
ncbi:hypothetical protein [Oryza sativa Japonica Group]|uniref:Uncharacterized protein n=1 Tax=Oryza sativa subsp. japonica TaxID=39947 RepID=Q5QLX6_ORYSJ|nr:hypothetical protein [Oryza sativa Japonica Group]